MTSQTLIVCENLFERGETVDEVLLLESVRHVLVNEGARSEHPPGAFDSPIESGDDRALAVAEQRRRLLLPEEWPTVCPGGERLGTGTDGIERTQRVNGRVAERTGVGEVAVFAT